MSGDTEYEGFIANLNRATTVNKILKDIQGFFIDGQRSHAAMFKSFLYGFYNVLSAFRAKHMIFAKSRAAGTAV
jgi:hypothetical protein